MEETALAACAFAGFGLIARRPLMLLAWWLGVLVLCSLVVGGGLLLSGTDRPGGFVVHLSGLAGIPVLWLVGTLLICAVFRQVLRPERRPVGLQLGWDELWLSPLILALGLILTAGMTGMVLPGPQRLAATAALLLASPWVCLIAPAAFASRRPDLLQGWQLAKGRYLGLLGMNLLTWGIYATASVLLGKLWTWLVILNDAQIDHAIHRGTGAVAWLLAGAAVLAVLIYGALLIVVAAPSAEAYRRLTSPPAPGP